MKEITRDDLAGTKLMVTPEQSAKIQMLAFSLGFAWAYGGTRVKNIYSPYLVFTESCILKGDDYDAAPFRELKYEDLFPCDRDESGVRPQDNGNGQRDKSPKLPEPEHPTLKEEFAQFTELVREMREAETYWRKMDYSKANLEPMIALGNMQRLQQAVDLKLTELKEVGRDNREKEKVDGFNKQSQVPGDSNSLLLPGGNREDN